LAQATADVAALGRIPLMTVTDGNCAFDTFLFFEGKPRGSANRRISRLEVVASIRDSCSDARWQSAFRQTAEGLPEPPSVESSALAATPLATAASTAPPLPTLPPAPLPPPPAPPPPPALDSRAEGDEGDPPLASGEVDFEAKSDPSIGKAILLHAGLDAIGPCELANLENKMSVDDKRYLLNYLKKHRAPIKTKSKSRRRTTRGRADATMRQKREDAKKIATHCASVGVDPQCDRMPKGFWPNFFAQTYVTTRKASARRLKMYWLRRLREWNKSSKQGRYECDKHAGIKKPKDDRNNGRRRLRKTQGRPVKALAIENELVKWFAGVRNSGCRVSPKRFLTQAKRIQHEYIRLAVAAGKPSRTPTVDKQWSRRVRLRNCISLKVVNLRYKVSKRVLHNRMVIGWSNAFRIRSSVLKLFGYDPVIYSMDQKPFHFDESGSKNQKTLGWTGQQETAND
jgi:hypothetical protein